MFSVFKAERIQRGKAPQNEVEVETGFVTAGDAMDRANALRRADPAHSYMVG